MLEIVRLVVASRTSSVVVSKVLLKMLDHPAVLVVSLVSMSNVRSPVPILAVAIRTVWSRLSSLGITG